jgi:hypothetical protein
MKKDFSIKLLETLEDLYPEKSSYKKIAKKLNRNVDERFNKTIRYLSGSKRIYQRSSTANGEEPWVVITEKGIDYLREQKLIIFSRISLTKFKKEQYSSF